MLDETKILFENIKDFRYIINEGASQQEIVNAINNHEYLNLYYAGDDNSATGSRMVRPFVLGTLKSKQNDKNGVPNNGRLVLRAWQDKGNSDSLNPATQKRIPRHGHEFTTDTDGDQKPGWRLFFLDKIKAIYPTGKRFNDEGIINEDYYSDKFLFEAVTIPPNYHPNDKQMSSIIAKVTDVPKTKTKISGTTSIIKPDFTAQKTYLRGKPVDKLAAFTNTAKSNREVTARDVGILTNIVKNVWKKKLNQYFIAINDRNEFEAIDLKYKDQIPQERIVSDDDLAKLYSKYFPDEVKRKTDAQFKRFEEKNKSKVKDTKSIVKEIEKPVVHRKTFFKK